MAELLRLPPEGVRCIHTEGSGCYGHNGADDVAADAALIARAVPGRPVRVQWMREQENIAEPFGPAWWPRSRRRWTRTAAWLAEYAVWSNTHNRRPARAGC